MSTFRGTETSEIEIVTEMTDDLIEAVSIWMFVCACVCICLCVCVSGHAFVYGKK